MTTYKTPPVVIASEGRDGAQKRRDGTPEGCDVAPEGS